MLIGLIVDYTNFRKYGIFGIFLPNSWNWMEAYYLTGDEKRGKKVILGIWLIIFFIFMTLFIIPPFFRYSSLWWICFIIIIFLIDRIAYLDIKRIMKSYRKKDGVCQSPIP